MGMAGALAIRMDAKGSKDVGFWRPPFMPGDNLLIVGLWGDIELEFLGEKPGCGGASSWLTASALYKQ